MTINLSSSNFNYMITNYNDPSAPATISKWAMRTSAAIRTRPLPDHVRRVQQPGVRATSAATADPKADTLITASINGPATRRAVTNEAAYLTTHAAWPVPAEPGQRIRPGSAIVVWQKTVSGTPESFETLTQYYVEPGVLVPHQVTVPPGRLDCPGHR